MSGASESTRGIRTLPDEGEILTAAEIAWVQAMAVSGVAVENETPSGAVNGSNKTFTLANTPIAGSTRLYRSGLRLKLTSDYTVATATITLNEAPEVGENLIIDYRK